MHWIIENYEVRLRLAGVDVRFETEMTAEAVKEFGGDGQAWVRGGKTPSSQKN